MLLSLAAAAEVLIKVLVVVLVVTELVAHRSLVLLLWQLLLVQVEPVEFKGILQCTFPHLVVLA